MRETTSDELAAFFGVGETDVTKPEQILADVSEAKIDEFTRRALVNKAVADAENPTTKQGRELGGVLVKGSTGEVELARVNLTLGEAMAKSLQAAEAVDVDAVIKVLDGELRGLDGGPRDIFKNLPDEEVTAAIGVQRRADQQRVVTLKSTLLGISEASFRDGDFEHGLTALQAARVDMISAEPAWIVQTMAEAVAKADLEKPEVRTALVKILDSHVLGTTLDMEAKVSGKPTEELSGQEVVLKKGLEARTINQRIEAAEREAKLQAEYEKRMETAWDRKMSQAISDGKSSFREHFKGGNNYAARFRDRGEGSSHLADLTKDWKFSAEVTGDHRLSGVTGYLQVLENIMETPGYLDKVVTHGAEQFSSDLGGKSKTEYKHADKMTEWSEHIRRQVLSEIHGNALGILQGAIEYDGSGMNDRLRAQILRKSLEVLGHGHAFEGLIAGKGELTPEQALVRKALLEYTRNPMAGQEKLAEQDPGLADRRLARLRRLRDVASQADISVIQRQEEAKKTVRLKLEGEERRRSELKGKVSQSQEHLRVINDAKEKILNTTLNIRARGARIEQLKNTVNLEGYLKIGRKDKDNPPRVDISVDEVKAKQATQQIGELKEALEKNPQSRELLDKLAALEVDVRFFAELRDWATRVNEPQYNRTLKESGLFKKPKGSILVTAFDALPDPEPNIIWDEYNMNVNEAIKRVEKANTQHHKKSLQALREELATQINAKNMLEIAAQVDQTEQELSDRQVEAKRAADTLTQWAEKAIVGLAKDFVKNRLKTQLRSERRLSYS